MLAISDLLKLIWKSRSRKSSLVTTRPGRGQRTARGQALMIAKCSGLPCKSNTSIVTEQSKTKREKRDYFKKIKRERERKKRKTLTFGKRIKGAGKRVCVESYGAKQGKERCSSETSVFA
jgi:hypothetical protein